MFRKDAMVIAEIPHLRRYARALMRDPDKADDLVQNCLERALGRFHLWKSDRALRPWLFAIMHNLHIDMIRHQSIRRGEVSLDDVGELPSQAANQEGLLAAKAVLEEIDRLPQDHKDVLILVGIDELTYSEAAKVLSIPTGTLMSRLHRARAKLRENLGMAGRKPAIRRVK